MFKEVNLQEKVCKDKYILMKNSREEFCEIPKEYIKNIHYEWHDICYMDIEVPYHISVDGVKKVNPLYDKFLGKRQYIKVNDEEKYVVTDCDRTEDYTGKKVKTIKAQSAEITLNDFDFYIGEGGITRKLFKVENDIDISDGILDLSIAETGWKIGTVSDKARLEMNKINEIYYKDLYSSLQKNNVAKEMVLWEKSFTDLNPLVNNVLTVNISYKNIKSYIDGKLQKDENAIHQLGSFHTGIKKIKAIYSGNDEYRYAIKYEITLNDNLTTEKWCEFTYLGAMNVNFGNIAMNYTTGLEVEKSYLKYRSFDEGIYKIYDFLKQEVGQAFGVKFIFDTMNKRINCHHFSEVGEETSLFLSYENFIKTINKKSQYDEIISKLYVESQKATISEENPTGMDYILDFTYFRENGLMSDELMSAYDRYLVAIDGKQEIIVTKRIDLNTFNKKKIKLDTERKTLEENLKGLQSIWSAYVKEKDDINSTRMAVEINEVQAKINANLRETELCRQSINSLNEEIKTIVDSITISTASDTQGKIFNDELLEELNDITITDTLSDDYYTTSYSLYNYAVETLSKRNKLPIEFSIDTVGLLQNMIIPEGYKFDNILKLGNFINIKDDEIENGKVRLASFDYSPRDFKADGFQFSNNDEDFTELNKMSNIGRSINKNITYTNNYKTSWVAGKDVNNFVNSMLTDYLDAKAVNIRSRQGRNKYDQSEVGMFVIDALSENESSQIYIGSGSICFTDDNWLHCQTCLDGGGLVGSTIVGRIIAGHNLLIGNENNTMIIDENGISIEGNYLSIKGVDGTNKDFNSYITMLSNQIALGVADSKSHTDAQIKVLSDEISLKVSSLGENLTIVEQKITPEGILSSVNTQIGEGGQIDTVSTLLNKQGFIVRNGCIQILNNAGQTVLQGDVNGNLILAQHGTVQIGNSWFGDGGTQLFDYVSFKSSDDPNKNIYYSKTGNIYPATSGTCGIGTATNYFDTIAGRALGLPRTIGHNTVLAGGQVYVRSAYDGDGIVADNEGYFFPVANADWSLGRPTNRWSTIYAYNLDMPSDEGLKENVRYLTQNYSKFKTLSEDIALTNEDCYEFIKELKLAEYDYKTDDNKLKNQIGFIAQDVLEISNAISSKIINTNNNSLSYSVNNYINVVVGALQVVIAKIDNIENVLNERA